MIRALAALCLLSAPAAAESLIGDWHCLQEAAEVRVEAEAHFTADGRFVADMEFRFLRAGSEVIVTAAYAATWQLDGSAFWDTPLDARISTVTVNGEMADLPDLAKGIRDQLMEPPDAPMIVTFPQEDFMLMRGSDGGGAPFQCLRVGATTDL